MRLTLPRRLINSIRCQRGQVVVVAVGVMALGLGAIMISVDAGWWLRDKRDAQNDADAIALAAVQELPDTVAAELRGEDWAVANSVDPSTEMAPPECTDADAVPQGNFCFIDLNGDGESDKVRVKVSRPSNSFIAEALGVGTPTLNPPAAAARMWITGGECIMPWAVAAAENDPTTHFGLDPKELHVFMNDPSAHHEPGNYGGLGLYGDNNHDYTQAILGNCAELECGDTYVVEGQTLIDCKTMTGVGGNTAKTLDERYPEPSRGECDVDPGEDGYQEALDKADPDGDFPQCAGADPEDPVPSRVVMISIIDAFPSGAGNLTVYGIGTFYIAGWCKVGDHDCPAAGNVYGYLLTDIDILPPENILTGVSDNPFAPRVEELVE